MPTRKDSPKKGGDNTTAFTNAIEFLENQQRIKELSDRNDFLKDSLKEYTTKNGYQNDSGHQSITVVSRDGKRHIQLKNTARNSAVLNTDALEVIKSDMPALAKKVVERIETVREDRLKTMIQEGKIDAKGAERLYTVNTSYAFSAKQVNAND